MLGILDEVSYGREEIEFKKVVSRMIVYAWYPILQYRLSFGVYDKLNKPVNYVSEKYKFAPNCDEKELLEFIYSSEDKELQLMIRDLTKYVPYRLMCPFFEDDLRGKKDYIKNKLIVKLSLESDNCLYKIIKSWIYYKLICFLQKRNPNVPAIAFKL